jgi:hypothetical protein
MRIALSAGARLMLLTLIGAAAAQAQEPVATGAALSVIGTAVFPKPQGLAITVVSPASPLSVIGGAQFPRPSGVSIVVASPPTPYAVLGQVSFPKPQALSVSLLVQEGAQVASAPPPPPPPPMAGAAGASTGTPGPEALAAIAAASFPAARPLSVTLVPPPTPLSAIAVGTFPQPQPLSVTLVPPPTPLAAIAAAKFPAPAPLSVTLYAGEPLFAATMVAGLAPGLMLGTGQYTVQIVQVIPRRGAQFFDHRDPTGAGSVLVAGAATQTVSGAPLAGGGGPLGPVCVAPATPPLSADVCGTTLSLSDDGFPFGANLGPQGNRSMHLTPVGGAQIQLAAQTGITPNAACPGLLCMATQVFTPGAACDNVSFVDTGTPKAPIVRFRRNGGQVCAQRLQ